MAIHELSKQVPTGQICRWFLRAPPGHLSLHQAGLYGGIANDNRRRIARAWLIPSASRRSLSFPYWTTAVRGSSRLPTSAPRIISMSSGIFRRTRICGQRRLVNRDSRIHAAFARPFVGSMLTIGLAEALALSVAGWTFIFVHHRRDTSKRTTRWRGLSLLGGEARGGVDGRRLAYSLPELSAAPSPERGCRPEDVPAGSARVAKRRRGGDRPDGDPSRRTVRRDDIIGDGCFLERERLDTLLGTRRPPGTGKTWLAKRLGFALIRKSASPFQFHSRTRTSYAAGAPGSWTGLSSRRSAAGVTCSEEIRGPAQIGEMHPARGDKRTPAEAIALSYRRLPRARSHPAELLRIDHERGRPFAGSRGLRPGRRFAFDLDRRSETWRTVGERAVPEGGVPAGHRTA